MNSDRIHLTRVNRSSWFILEHQNIIIHIDPGYAGLFENQGIHSTTFEKKANYIFISHPHKDHIRMDMIEQILTPSTIILAPSSCKTELTVPFHILNQGESYDDYGCSVIAVPAYNTETGRSTRKYHPKGEFNGYILKLGNKRIYFAGDTDCIPEMSIFGPLDVALLPIGGTYVMDLEEAVEATSVLKPHCVIPMHQADSSLTLFQSKVRDFGLQCILLNPGETTYIT